MTTARPRSFASRRRTLPRPGRRRPKRFSILALLPTLLVIVLAALVGSASTVAIARWTGWTQTTKVVTIDSRTTAIQTVLAKVNPSVVSISATSGRASPVFGSSSNSTARTAKGTGVIVTRGGEVVTNDHVIAGASAITVTVDGYAVPLRATILATAPDNDLALLRIDGPGPFTPAHFADSSSSKVGDEVIAFGYALGLPGGPSVTEGIISAVDRQVATRTATGTTTTLTGMLQTDAAISSGNSGGPLVNSAGQVVGINTAVATSSGTTTAQNIGFAIPSLSVEMTLAKYLT